MEDAAIAAESAASTTMAQDLLDGAQEIAEFLFGEGADRRRVYYLIGRGLPHFKLGARIFARRSSIVTWVARQEAQNDR